MIIHTTSFVKSSTNLSQCPTPSMPEFAFIGRSNVGKSSLINMLTGRSKLAKTSGQPGKHELLTIFLLTTTGILLTCLVMDMQKCKIR